jgi:hypothetical protein
MACRDLSKADREPRHPGIDLTHMTLPHISSVCRRAFAPSSLIGPLRVARLMLQRADLAAALGRRHEARGLAQVRAPGRVGSISSPPVGPVARGESKPMERL